MGSTLITLLPKISNPRSFSYFRPISLANFISKFATRIIATRMQPVLQRIISMEQAGFVKGRDISDQIVMAREMVHLLKNKVRGSNTIIKLDMMKAFNRVNWTFLTTLLSRFGFAATFIKIIFNHLKGTHLSVLVNGVPFGFFQPSRGVKQGDPLSPILFILAAEAFSRGINKLVEQGVISSFNTGRSKPITHLSFVDDLLVFLNGGLMNLRKFRNFLVSYQRVSGQAANF